MAEEQDDTKTELSIEELVKIANNLNAQVQQQNLMIRDMGDKLGRKEAENSQLRAVITQIQGGTNPPPSVDDGDAVTEEE
tara:strand:+ start:331 stop:570 length:240 start_codon:yes stop_codon:yes gene_type:complete